MFRKLPFTGISDEMTTVNKYGMITGCNDDKLKMLALQTAKLPFTGISDEMTTVNKYGMITRCDDDKLKMLALQTADRPLSDYLHSWLSAHPAPVVSGVTIALR